MFIKLFKDLIKDAELKAEAQSKNAKYYASCTDLKDMKTGKNCYVDVINHKIITW